SLACHPLTAGGKVSRRLPQQLEREVQPCPWAAAPGPRRSGPATEPPMSTEGLGWYASIFAWLFFTGIGIPPCPEEAGILYAAGLHTIHPEAVSWPVATHARGPPTPSGRLVWRPAAQRLPAPPRPWRLPTPVKSSAAKKPDSDHR